MQLKTILTVLAAVLTVASAAPAPVADVDITAVPPGPRLSKSVIDINEIENEGLNDENSKIIFYPGGGGGGYPPPPYYPSGGRPPVIIIISPYGSRGPGGGSGGGGVLLKRPRKRSDEDAEDEDSNVMILLAQGSTSVLPSGRPFPKRDDVDEASKILLVQPGAGPRPRYPPWTYDGYPPGYPLGRHQPSQEPGTLETRSGKKKDKSGKKKGHHPHSKRDKAESKSGKKKAKAKAENEAFDWEDYDDFADENDQVKYSLIYPPSPY